MPPAVSLTRSSSGGFNEACKQDLMGVVETDGSAPPAGVQTRPCGKSALIVGGNFFFSLFFPFRYCFCSIGWICLRCSLFLSVLREFLLEINKVFI